MADSTRNVVRYENIAQIRCGCGEVTIIRFQTVRDVLDSRCRFCGGTLFVTARGAKAFMAEFAEDMAEFAKDVKTACK
jgi:hypothetical protein